MQLLLLLYRLLLGFLYLFLPCFSFSLSCGLPGLAISDSHLSGQQKEAKDEGQVNVVGSHCVEVVFFDIFEDPLPFCVGLDFEIGLASSGSEESHLLYKLFLGGEGLCLEPVEDVCALVVDFLLGEACKQEEDLHYFLVFEHSAVKQHIEEGIKLILHQILLQFLYPESVHLQLSQLFVGLYLLHFFMAGKLFILLFH